MAEIPLNYKLRLVSVTHSGREVASINQISGMTQTTITTRNALFGFHRVPPEFVHWAGTTLSWSPALTRSPVCLDDSI